jgi:alanyl-tRNA synthetase
VSSHLSNPCVQGAFPASSDLFQERGQTFCLSKDSYKHPLILRKMTSSEFDLEFFKQGGFIRRQCPKCGRHFWTLGEWLTCGEPPCEEYTFIGDSPMKVSLGLHQTREAFLSFFEENGHGRIGRYPIVARWRDDVFFTQASIYNFQPWVINGVVDPPANPLVLSQTCVRFNDIDNVGKTGRHMTFFEMLAHHAFNKVGREIYFKDRTVELCHRFFTERMGTDPERMRYVEAWWEGGGNSGPCLEVILDGAEVATLVFMMYRDTSQGRVPLDMKVVDTGYGLERISWVSQGASSAYEAVFGDPLMFLKAQMDVTEDNEVLMEYSKVAGMTNARTTADVRRIREITARRLGIDFDHLMSLVSPLEEMYVICDHSRALAFLFNDGVVPSNVREGYFARLLVRRALRSMRSLGLDMALADVVEEQVRYFAPHFPELCDNEEDILNLVGVEEARYHETLSRGGQLVNRLIEGLSEGESLSTEKLIELYDSHGLNPEIVREFAPVPVDIPDDFYIQVAARHETPEEAEEETIQLPEGLPETKMLYYDDPELSEFEADVLAHVNSAAVLDRTAFYPEGGGQENDLGLLDGNHVRRVIKIGTVILHYMEAPLPSVGRRVSGVIDMGRRVQLMRHHTAAHIINGMARSMLGNHVWQAGAHKSMEEARLDITHYENLSQEQRDRLEREANRIVLENHPVVVRLMPRDEAEKRYGHSLYQGGVVPGKIIRVVDIPGIDAEACGGIHCRNTGEVGPIRIRRTKRIQDGVVRIEYTAGDASVLEMQEERNSMEALTELLNTTKAQIVDVTEALLGENRRLRKDLEKVSKEKSEHLADELLKSAFEIDGVKLVTYLDGDDEDIASLSKRLSSCPNTVVVIGQLGSQRIMVSRSENLELDAREILRELTLIAGGGGGGRPEFAQGGGCDLEKMREAFSKVEETVSRMLIRKS